MRPLLLEVLTSSASRGLAPREGLVLLMLKLGHTRALMEPLHGPQAGKSRYPGYQNADSRPQDQGVLGLGFEAKPKGKCEASQAPIACGPPRGFIDGLVWPSFNTNTARPSRGAKPREADGAKTPKGVGLLRRAPEGRRDLCSYLMRLS